MPVRFPRYDDDDLPRGVSTRLLRRVVSSINKKYKKDRHQEIAASLLGNSVFSQPRGYVSSGIIPIDCVVCFGLGFPTAIVEIYGGEATGKSAIGEQTLAESQKRGYYTIMIPTEYSLDYRRAKAIGLDPDELIILEAETVEDVYDLLKQTVSMIREKDADTPIVAVWDSVAATPTRTEIAEKADLETSDMGRSALQISKLFRRMMRFFFKNKVCLICINQVRTNIAQMYGSKESTYGGRALKFYASVRCRLRKVKDIKGPDDEVIGVLCDLECKKNRVAPPFRHCRFPIYWTKGIDNAMAVFEYAVDKGIFEKKGTAYKWHGRVLTRKSFPKFYRRKRKKIDALLRRSTIPPKEDK